MFSQTLCSLSFSTNENMLYFKRLLSAANMDSLNQSGKRCPDCSVMSQEWTNIWIGFFWGRCSQLKAEIHSTFHSLTADGWVWHFLQIKYYLKTPLILFILNQTFKIQLPLHELSQGKKKGKLKKQAKLGRKNVFIPNYFPEGWRQKDYTQQFNRRQVQSMTDAKACKAA